MGFAARALAPSVLAFASAFAAYVTLGFVYGWMTVTSHMLVVAYFVAHLLTIH